jgi:pilus assembly protein CpaB
MNARNIILIVVAVLLVGGTAFLAKNWLSAQRAPVQQAAPVKEEPKIQVLVAETDMPTGTFLKEISFRWQSWPDNQIPPNYLLKGEFDPKSLEGAVLRRTLAAGEPLTRGRFVSPGERGFLAAVLKPGFRAMSMRVNATSSIAGLVFPGDRVDLILTHGIEIKYLNEEGKPEQSETRNVSETILSNVRILAIDQTLESQTNAPQVGKNVTFEVTPKQAEMLAVSDEIGKISLSLRSLAKDEEELKRLAETGEDPDMGDPFKQPTVTWDTEASQPLHFNPPGRPNGDAITIFRGGNSGKKAK